MIGGGGNLRNKSHRSPMERGNFFPEKKDGQEGGERVRGP